MDWVVLKMTRGEKRMTVKEFVQSLLLILCIMASSVVLPVGLVVGSSAHDTRAAATSAGPVFIFEDTR